MSKKIYPSKYTDSKVTDSQYICDEIMERIAKKDSKTLPYKYWNAPQWNKVFRRQIAAANALLSEAECLTIMNFLRSSKGKNIYSLGLKKPILEGCKKIQGVDVAFIHMDEIDPFIDDTIEEEIITSEPKVSLWEKLQ